MPTAKGQIEIKTDKIEYRAGDLVTGKVCCTFNEMIYIGAVMVRLDREELSNLIGKNGAPSTGENRCVLEGKTLSGEAIFDAQQYNFDFSFQLPEKLASTFTFQSGHVKYFLKAVARARSSEDIQAEMEFSVVSRIDFNEFPVETLHKEHRQSTKVNLSSSLCFSICFSTGAIELDASLPKRAFIPGEEIKFSLDVVNLSSKKIAKVEAYLVQRIQAKTTSPTNHTGTTLQVLGITRQRGLKPDCQKKYNFALKINSNAVIPDFTECRLFRKSCTLEVVAVVRDSVVKLSIPVVLGHVPLRRREGSRSTVLQHELLDEAIGDRPSVPLNSNTLSPGRCSPPSSFRPTPASTPRLEERQSVPEDAPPSYESICRATTRTVLETSTAISSEHNQNRPPYPTSPPPYPDPPRNSDSRGISSTPTSSTGMYPPMPLPPPNSTFHIVPFQSLPPYPVEDPPSGGSAIQSDVLHTTATPQAPHSATKWNLVRSAVPSVAANHRLPYPNEVASFSNASIPISSLLFSPMSMACDGLYPPPKEAVNAFRDGPHLASAPKLGDSSPSNIPIGFGMLEAVVAAIEQESRFSRANT